MGPLRAAYLATGDEKWGHAYKDVVMSRSGSSRTTAISGATITSTSPGPWDGLAAVVSHSGAYDILGAAKHPDRRRKGPDHPDDPGDGRELAWTISYSNFIVHNAWGRWLGSLGFVVSCWPDIPEAPDWRTLVEGRLPFLYSGIDKDGGWWEKTIAYHIFTFDLVEESYDASRKLHGVDLFRRELNGRRLDMMLDWLVKIAPPGGEMPLFNDSQKLNLRNDGAAIRMARTLRRGDFFKALNLREDKADPAEPDRPKIEWRTPAFTSVLFEESGYGIFRDGWEPDDFYGAVKFGEHGGGHGHYDKASLYIQAYGHPWLIDPGYGRERDPQAQHRRRRRTGPRGRRRDRLLAWHHGDALDMIAVSHRGYQDVVHRRAVVFMKPDRMLVADILDPLDGRAHAYDWLLQFRQTTATPERQAGSADRGSGVKVTFPGNDPDGARTLAATLNVNELPSNYQRMGNDSLYLEIWRGRWSEKTTAAPPSPP